MAKIHLKAGDSVVVRPQVKDPDFGRPIGGWQGRVAEINEKENQICIHWDSLTLKQMPGETIDRSEVEGFEWTLMYLQPEEVELTRPRDKEEVVVEATIEELQKKHGWSYLGEEGKRIQAVVHQADEDDEVTVFEAWEKHLRQVLNFPFEVRIEEGEYHEPLCIGNKVNVLSIESVDDLYGILVNVHHGRKPYVFPLADLEVTEKSSANYQPVKDYVVWFANR